MISIPTLSRSLAPSALLIGWAAACAGCAPEQRSPGAWPQWRGPTGQGLVSEAGLPTRWRTDSPNLRWRTPIPGNGNSSPIISHGLVFLTASVAASAEGGDQRLTHLVVAVDAASGELLWQTEIFTSPAFTKHRLNTWAAPTPVTDGTYVFAYFGSWLAKLDRAGVVVWRHEIDPAYGLTSHYGAVSSPVLSDELIVVVQDRERIETGDTAWMAAYDRDTGERRWYTTWDDTCCAYSTPLLIRDADGQRMIYAHSGFVSEYDLATGDRLWSQEYTALQMVPTPVLDGDTLCVLGGAHRRRGNMCMKLPARGAQPAPEVLWTLWGNAPHDSSPVLYQGLLYAVTDEGIMSCYRAESGERLWRTRLPRGNYRASLLAGDGKIFVTESRGLTHVVAAADTYTLLSTNELDEGSNASPAVGEGCYLIRTRHTLVCVDTAPGAEDNAAHGAEGETAPGAEGETAPGAEGETAPGAEDNAASGAGAAG